MNNDQNTQPLVRYKFNEESCELESIIIEIFPSTTDALIKEEWENKPHIIQTLKDLRNLVKRKKEEGLRKEPTISDPILQFFPDFRKYGRTCFIADGQQSWYSSQRLVAEGKARDRTDPVILINSLRNAGIDLCYYSWCMATKKQSQIDFMNALEHNGFVTRNFPVTKENETESGNVDHLVSQEITTAAMEHKCDTFILFFGDKDYENQIRTLKNSGKRIILIINSSMASKAIKSLADTCIEVEHITHHVIPKRPLLKQYWWFVYKHDPDTLSFLSEEEKSIVRPLYQEYLKQTERVKEDKKETPKPKLKHPNPIKLKK